MCDYVPLTQKDSVNHILKVYAKEGLSFTWDLSLENSGSLFLFSTGFTSLFYFFSSIDHLLSPFNIDEVLLIKASANAFVFGD